MKKAGCEPAKGNPPEGPQPIYKLTLLQGSQLGSQGLNKCTEEKNRCFAYFAD